MTRTFRPGAIGALMDEYERAASDLASVISRLPESEFERQRDSKTEDEDCRSIQTVVSHVVRAGYGYAFRIRSAFGMPASPPERRVLSRDEALEGLTAMLAHTAETLEGRWLMTDAEIAAVRIDAPWGPTYDLEQLLEHAVVHVLRHRRQIERFLSDPAFAAAG